MRLDAADVPFLTNHAIEIRARLLLEQSAVVLRRELVPPIPIDEILERVLRTTLDIDNLQQRLGLKNVLGATFFSEKSLVVIDDSLACESGRFFFTVAHEAAHVHLHRPWVLEQKARWGSLLTDDALFVACTEGEQFVRPRVEAQADRFAASLLMPRNAVRAAAHMVQQEQGIASTEDFVRAVLDVGVFTNVSLQALTIRMQMLGLLESEPAVACG